MENTLLNLIPAAYLPEIHLSQYDTGRTITFTLKDGASDYSVPSGASVKVKATKPSGFGFEVACTFNGGTVTLVTTDTMTPENGRFPAELSIVSGNTTIGTSNFIFNIERSPHPEGTIDGDAETIIPELTLLVERIEAAADSVDEDTQIVTEAKAEVLQAKADTLQAKADTLSARDESVSAKDLAVSSAQTSVEASQRAEELVGSVETKADAIVKTASGEIASFPDGGDELPVKSLKVNITPKQSGSGDPSPDNVRPISGTDSVKVTDCGKNLFSLSMIEDSDFTLINGYYRSTKPVLKAGTYIWTGIDFSSSTSGLLVRFNDGSKVLELVTRSAVVPTYERTFDNDAYIEFNYTKSGLLSTLNSFVGQLELGSTATAYEPYNGTTYTISLGQTVYGGTLDVVSGVLTITHGYVDLGSLNWSYANARFNTSSRLPSVLIQADWGVYGICSAYKRTGQLPPIPSADKDKTFSIYSGYCYVADSSYTDATAFKTAMNGVQLVYELATPTTITLTPTQVTTLLGNNNIWADSGTVEVEYRADTTLAYNELLAMILENIGN